MIAGASWGGPGGHEGRGQDRAFWSGHVGESLQEGALPRRSAGGGAEWAGSAGGAFSSCAGCDAPVAPDASVIAGRSVAAVRGSAYAYSRVEVSEQMCLRSNAADAGGSWRPPCQLPRCASQPAPSPREWHGRRDRLAAGRVSSPPPLVAANLRAGPWRATIDNKRLTCLSSRPAVYDGCRWQKGHGLVAREAEPDPGLSHSRRSHICSLAKPISR